MLIYSKFPFKSSISDIKLSDNKWTTYLLKWWYIRQELAWVYNYLPFWLRVLNNIKNIVIKHFTKLWSHEMLMSSIWSKEHWECAWRQWIDVLYNLQFSNWKNHFLNPTHEELICPIVSEFVKSYKDLPFSIFQVQTKFRNEKRAKSWILRWREFLMKDMYSFHQSLEDFDIFYKRTMQTYKEIYDELWIWDCTFVTYASWWIFSKYSHEFQTLLDIWEDVIYLDRVKKLAVNKEIIEDIKNTDEFKDFNFEEVNACEVWNIFKLWTKFSDPFNIKYLDENWIQKEVLMWCYWIWVSRIMWVIAEKFLDEKWLYWPQSIAPFDFHLINLWEDNLEKTIELWKKLENLWKQVLVDDRIINPWVKLNDFDLLWIPNRIIISKKSLKNWWFEYKHRKSNETKILWFDEINKLT